MNNRKSLYDRIRDNNLSFVWLISILKNNGIQTDKSEMSSAAKGTISGKKANDIVEKSHQILDKYEEFIRSIKV